MKVAVKMLQRHKTSRKVFNKGETYHVSKWVAQAWCDGKDAVAMRINASTRAPLNPIKAKRAQNTPELTMSELRRMREAGEYKAAREILKRRYGIKASGWDDLLAKALRVLEDDE